MERNSLLVDPETQVQGNKSGYRTFGSKNDSTRGSRQASLRDSMRQLGRSARNSIQDSLRFGGRQVSVRDLGGTSTITKSSFNLIKNIVGAGVLALPAGVASFADSPSAVIPAAGWVCAMGLAFAYSFQLIAKTCKMTQSVTFREVWEETMGYDGALTVSMVNMLKPALGNLAYSMILADTFKALFATAGFETTRILSLLLVTILGILPLCLLKNLDALAPFSILGTAGIFLIAVCMTIRYFDGTYDVENDGVFLQDLDEKYIPQFGNYNGAWTGAVLIFAAMLFESFVAHYNAPRFMAELKNSNIHRFRIVVGNAFIFSSLVYVWMTAIGFLTFGGNCNGYILNNYSTNDRLATICRLSIAFSILFTYPITFMGFRDGVLDAIDLPQEKQTSSNINIITIFLLTIITILAAICTDLGAINAIGGGTLATLIVFVFPYLMYRKAVGENSTIEERREVSFALLLMLVGVLMGIVGVVVELHHL
mmetsp:Transcript_40699/g.85505  ORF Transcript_40699/g.85505 Transcript_40699/m.85505 type:complete len:482 (-) Transcript_40699:249-1694(-)